MPIKTYKPVTPALRFTATTEATLSRERPLRSLLLPRKQRAGRNAEGRITVRHRGGGHRRHIRQVDFRRDKTGIPARVARLEYDPMRSAHLALLYYRDGEKRYILAPQGLAVGATVVSGPEAEPTVGNALPLERIPLGLSVHNIELAPGGGGRLVRSAGMAAVLMSREGRHANVKLPSGEIRLVNVKCLATIGQVGNLEHENVMDGKAGRTRWRGIRPTVRGVAMNPIDHPMGGGEARASGGHPKSPWGQYAKGFKTRKKRKSLKFIVARRK
jgi:large subunit ribosomal protein L2